MQKVDISIIVPVYNLQTYVKECLDSLMDQDFNNYEVIVVDDGSIDGSGKVCDDYADRYEKLLVIHQPNRGLSAARNAGLAIAKGRYILFVDGDDCLEKNSLTNIYDICERAGTNIIRFNWYTFSDSDDTMVALASCPCQLKNKTYTQNEEYIRETMKNNWYIVCAPFAVYSREFLVNNKILFPVGRLYEDNVFSLEILCIDSVSVYQSDYAFYYTRERNGSITRSGFGLKNLKETNLIIKLMANVLKLRQKQSAIFKSVISSYLVGVISSLTNSDITYQYDTELKDELKVLRNYCHIYGEYAVTRHQRLNILLFSVLPMRIYRWVYRAVKSILHKKIIETVSWRQIWM